MIEHTTPLLLVIIGTKERVWVSHPAEASKFYLSYLDRNFLGSREAPSAHLFHEDLLVGYVSYNGKVWKGDPANWKQNRLIFEPQPVVKD